MRTLNKLLLPAALALASCTDPTAIGGAEQALASDPVNLVTWAGGARFARLGADVEVYFGFRAGPDSAVAPTNVVVHLDVTGAFAPIGNVADPIVGCTFSETPGHAAYDCLLATAELDRNYVSRIFIHPTAVGRITITSTVAADQPEREPSDNQATALVDVYDQPIADLAIYPGKVVKPPPGGVLGEVAIGYPAVTRFFVEDYGPGDSSGFRVALSLTGPAHFTSPLAAECVVVSDTRVDCTYGPKVPFDDVSVAAASFLPTGLGDVVVTATLTGAELDPDPANNVSVRRFYPYQPRFADVGVTVAATSARYLFRDPVTYRITVTNHGPDAANGVVVEHYLDSSMTIRSLAPSQGASCTNADNAAWCELGTLATGASTTLVIVAQPSLGGTFSSYTQAQHQGGHTLDLDGSNNEARTPITLRGPNPPVTVTTTSTRYPLEAWGYLPCVAEDVLLFGELHQVTQWQWNRNQQTGRWTERDNYAGVSGLGLVTGRTYHAAGTWGSTSTVTVNGPATYTRTNHLNLVSQGGGPNLVAHFSYKLEVDAEGNVVTELQRAWTTCR